MRTGQRNIQPTIAFYCYQQASSQYTDARARVFAELKQNLTGWADLSTAHAYRLSHQTEEIVITARGALEVSGNPHEVIKLQTEIGKLIKSAFGRGIDSIFVRASDDPEAKAAIGTFTGAFVRDAISFCSVIIGDQHVRHVE